MAEPQQVVDRLACPRLLVATDVGHVQSGVGAVDEEHRHVGGRELAVQVVDGLDALEGGVFLDGTDIRDLTQQALRRSMAVVRQETAMFNRSAMDNIRYGRPNATEEEIIAARQQAERANKANSAFLAAASHDLRQPVQALSLLNGALRRTVKDERALEMIKSQDHSLTAMTNLLNSLLDISRLDAGAVTPEFEDFPIQRLIDRLSAEFARQARHKGLEFQSCDCPVVVRSDPNLLGEIIQNLVSNALRYTDKGKVELLCDHGDGQCYINVVDTGIGIGEDQQEAVYQHAGTLSAVPPAAYTWRQIRAF